VLEIDIFGTFAKWHPSGHYFFHCGDSFSWETIQKSNYLPVQIISQDMHGPWHGWWLVGIMRVSSDNGCPLFDIQKRNDTGCHWCHQLMEVVAIFIMATIGFIWQK
jgi:hypothetical protein